MSAVTGFTHVQTNSTCASRHWSRCVFGVGVARKLEMPSRRYCEHLSEEELGEHNSLEALRP